MPSLVLDEPHGSVLRDAGLRGAARADRVRAGARRALGHLGVGLRRARPHAGLPVRAAGRAAAGAAPHAARRTGDRALRHRAGGAGRAAPRLPPTSRRCEALGARGALRLHRGARLHARAPGRRRALHAGGHLHGAPPGHDASWRWPTCCWTAWRSAGAWPTRTSRRWPRCCTSARRARCRCCYAPPPGPPPQALQRRAPGLLREVLPGATALEPTHLLSNGRYSVTLRANGAGWSRWGTTGITRWRDDALRDALRQLLLPALGPAAAARCRSPSTRRPTRPRTTSSTFHADRVCFDAAWPELQAHTTVWVSPEDDIEFRQVELRNLERSHARHRADVGLRGDAGRPARRRGAPGVLATCSCAREWRAAQQALVFERTPRLATERGLQAAHFLADTDPQVVGVRVQTDRQRWLGRNRGASRPLASFDARRPRRPTARPARAGHRPRPGVRAGRAPAHRAAARKAQLTFATAASDNGGALQRGDRQVPPAQPRAARLADVGHADRHPPARRCASAPRTSPPSRR